MKKSYLSLLLTLMLPTLMYAQANMVGGRKVTLQKCMVVQEPLLTLELWDAGVEDNDTVTLFLNGEKILENHRVTKAREQFQYLLKPGPNQLVLHANNLGDLPNNTAAFSVNGNEKISLNSGLEKSGSMQIHFAGSPAEAALVKCDPKLADDDAEASAIRKNPMMAMPSYTLMTQGLRFNASEPFRTVQIQDCYNATNSEVTLLLWDCGVEDGDTVSVMLNGQWILNYHRLTKGSNRVPVKLQKGENIIVLYAHNLGSIPNNTAALAVDQPFSGKTDVGMMISDQNTCGAIRITYGMSDDYGNAVSPCLNENKIDSTQEPEIIYQTKMRQRNPSYNNPKPTPPTSTSPPPPVYYPSGPPVVVPVPTPSRPAPKTPPPVRRPSGGGSTTPTPPRNPKTPIPN